MRAVSLAKKHPGNVICMELHARCCWTCEHLHIAGLKLKNMCTFMRTNSCDSYAAIVRCKELIVDQIQTEKHRPLRVWHQAFRHCKCIGACVVNVLNAWID